MPNFRPQQGLGQPLGMGDMGMGGMSGTGGMPQMNPYMGQMQQSSPPGMAAVDERLEMRGMRPEVDKSGTRSNSKEFGRKWLARIVAAQTKQDAWKREGQLYYGMYYGDARAWRRAITIKGYKSPLILFTNPVSRNVDMDRDRMMPKNPTFKVWPKVRWMYFKGENDQEGRRDNIQAARVYQEVANLLALELDIRKTIKRAITDSLITNLGVVKISWDEVGSVTHSTAAITGDGDTAIAGTEFSEIPTHELVRPNYPWVTHVPWDKVVIDPLATNMEQVTWVAERVRLPAAEDSGPDIEETLSTSRKDNLTESEEYPVRNDGQYESDVKMKWKWEVHYLEANEAAPEGKYAYSFDLYDNGTVRRHKRYDIDLGSTVYEFLQFREVVGDLLGYSQIRYYASAAAHDNLAKQIMLDHGIRALPMLFVNSSIGKEAIAGATEGAAGKVIPIKQGLLKEVIMPVQLPGVSQEMMSMSQVIRAAADEMSGRSLNDRLQGGVQTATEAKVIDRNSGETLASTTDILRIHAARVMKKAVRVYANLLKDDIQEVPNGKGGFMKVTGQMLICDVAMELDWQSTVRKDDAVERKLNMDLLTVLANAMPFLPNINLEPVLKKIVVSSGFDDPSEIFKNPDAEPTEPAQEHMLILAGEAVRPSQDEDHQKNFQEHVDFAAVIDNDPQLKALWDRFPQAKQNLINHIAMHADMLQMAGEGGTVGLGGGGQPGSGPSGNRASQGMPNEGDMQAAATRGGSNPGGGGMTRLGGV